MKSILQVGDIVRIRDSKNNALDLSPAGFRVGQTVRVTATFPSLFRVVINGHDNSGLGWFEERFELVFRPPFAIGTKIMLIQAPGMAAKVGATATVKGYEELHGVYYVNVEWDRGNGLAGAQSHGSYMPSHFEDITGLKVRTDGWKLKDIAAPRYEWIVDPLPKAPAVEYVLMRKKDGEYKPAVTPKVYRTRAAAVAVAEKMAALHGGKFVVFASVVDAALPPPVKVQPVVTDHV